MSSLLPLAVWPLLAGAVPSSARFDRIQQVERTHVDCGIAERAAMLDAAAAADAACQPTHRAEVWPLGVPTVEAGTCVATMRWFCGSDADWSALRARTDSLVADPDVAPAAGVVIPAPTPPPVRRAAADPTPAAPPPVSWVRVYRAGADAATRWVAKTDETR
jgi:hypothetical protein